MSKTKLDSSFPSGQFVIKDYNTPFWLDRNQNGRGLLLYVCEDIPCKILKEYTPEKPIENFFVEINLRSRKWLLSCSYNPKTNLKLITYTVLVGGLISILQSMTILLFLVI